MSHQIHRFPPKETLLFVVYEFVFFIVRRCSSAWQSTSQPLDEISQRDLLGGQVKTWELRVFFSVIGVPFSDHRGCVKSWRCVLICQGVVGPDNNFTSVSSSFTNPGPASLLSCQVTLTTQIPEPKRPVSCLVAKFIHSV